MKWISSDVLIDAGGVLGTPIWDRIIQDLREAVDAVRWPPDAANFTIYPERHANGVGAIKRSFIAKLVERGWHKEGR